ncbi:hypothetical protein [Streptomyces sp. NPDC048002]|uniref:hypothetical protein n=1 Tax=Streptomyces sp. NPDC048002 TaxID=3154344 RepID=UPI0033E9B4AE
MQKAAAPQRLRAIGQAASAHIQPERRARVTPALRSKPLGLTGTVQERNRSSSRAGFLRNKESTRQLHAHPRNSHHRIPENVRASGSPATASRSAARS